jgi:hypothetical protein
MSGLKLSVVMLGLAACLAGCSQIPGSDAYYKTKAEEIVSQGLLDPDAAKFRKITVRKKREDDGKVTRVVCGEVNGKNRMGAYSGFVRFSVEPATGAYFIDPQSAMTEEDIMAAEGSCSRARNNPYSSPDITKQLCRRPNAIIEEMSAQAGFNSVWQGYCS